MATRDSYRHTVSKMARKYSQHRLPDLSELLSSNSLDIDTEDEKDKYAQDDDILPTQQSTDTCTNPKGKALFGDIFDQYFDESKEGDIDFNEFKNGLSKLGYDHHDTNTNKNEQEIKQLFNLLLNDDSNNMNGYLQKDQFCEFLITKYSNAQLRKFQNVLLNLINNIASAETEEIEMRQAMEQMVDYEMEKIKIKQEFEQEFEQELVRRKSDPQFCNDLNVDEWDCHEVAFWLHKNGYNYCMKKFFDLNIDGNVLLYDINIQMLKILGVKSVHYHKFISNLNKLRANKHKPKGIAIELIEQYDINNISIKSEPAKLLLTELKQDMDVHLSKHALRWDCQDVSNWLYTINLKKYIPQFMDSFVDGQILLKDINYENLIHDLQIKSIHAPKIIREINKLKHRMCSPYHTQYNVTNCTIESKQNMLIDELNTQINTLKNDLSETRIKVIQSTNQSNRSRRMSVYSEGNTNYINNRHTATATATALLPQNELSSNWQKYIKQLERKNRELSSLFLRADNNLKKYTKAIVPFQERISNLELQNQTRKQTIDKLNKRIQKRNQTIDKLKQQQQHVYVQQQQQQQPQQYQKQKQIINKSTLGVGPLNHKYASSSAPQLVGSAIFKQKRYRKKRHNVQLSNNGNSLVMHNRYASNASVASIQSAPVTQYSNQPLNSNNNNNFSDSNESIIGSLTSIAYDYFMGSNTPGNY